MRRRSILLLPLLLPVRALHAEPEPRTGNIMSPGECPLECCQYDQELVSPCVQSTTKSTSGVEVTFSLQPGDKFTLRKSFVFTRSAGIVRVKETAQAFKPNSGTDPINAVITLNRESTLLVLYRQGRNCHRLLYNGTRYSADITQALANQKLELVREPQFTWWAGIQNSIGQLGWARDPYELFAQSACGKNA